MKTTLDIIAGFLGSGKTTLINSLLQSPWVKKKRVLVIQLEKGVGKIKIKDNLSVVVLPKEKGLNKEEILKILEKVRPYHIFLEYNGFFQLEDFFKVLETREIRKKVALRKIYTTINSHTFYSYYQSLGPTFIEPVIQADVLLLTNGKKRTPVEIDRMRDMVGAINGDASIISSVTERDDSDLFRIGLNFESFTKRSLSYLLLLGSGFLIYLLLAIASQGDIRSIQYQSLLAFISIFISILLQALPFILLGVLISAIIQIFVSPDLITSLFAKNMILSMGAAMVAGVFFPICDCAIIPVMSRLVKKGIPLSAAVTFMLAAPIVDPIVIASTFYAFPGMPFMALSRIFLGLTIALITGLLFHFFPVKNEVLNMKGVGKRCSCGYCNPLYDYSHQGLVSKIKGVLSHAGEEFFHVGQFFIVAACFSSLIQVYLPQGILSFLTTNPLGALLSMMIFAFILSICSTSDAFIARNFLGDFTTGPVLGFMVFGAMMDIKNLFLLLGHFRKPFVIRLVFLIFLIAFSVLSLYIFLG